MSASFGFVYVLGNQYMPGIFKIGYTDGHPRARMAQLSRATACPVDFDLLAYFGSERARDTEQRIHRMLVESRVASGKEFFNTTAKRIMSIIDLVCPEGADARFVLGLARVMRSEQMEEDDAWPARYFFSQTADPLYWHDGLYTADDDLPF